MCQQTLAFSLWSLLLSGELPLWKQGAYLGVLCERFDKVLSVSDKDLPLRRVDRVGPRAPDSNATKGGPVRW